ncbi:hypothetical protein NLU13_6734 [Sarocladium strictum]|uniref:Zn(2)-C6 fungal-type domain-containing protein n=1 Tax=Sarocladium strictum TaxID=5046 RepID=A0AA39GDX3_SARSR|nr:hypothetical protein NLU13_6734 [Sarocladium strictum]
MPRKTGSERIRAFKNRTRSGCGACRARKVKCDENRPKCARCISRGDTCEYDRIDLKWETEYLSTGRAFGREGLWSKDGLEGKLRQNSALRSCPHSPVDSGRHHSFIGIHHFIHTRSRDIRIDSHDGLYLAPLSTSDLLAPTVSLDSTSHHMSSSPTITESDPMLLRNPSSYQSLSYNESTLLEYYLMRICPLANTREHSTSPFTSLMMPVLASGSQNLATLSAMAFSARHRSLKSPQWSGMALSLKGKALAALRQSLGAGNPTPMTVSLQSPQIPLAMMFLCLYEIIDNCNNAWVLHLRASQDFLSRRKKLCEPVAVESDAERSQFLLAENFFAFQDAISRTACGNSSVFGLEYWQSPIRQKDAVGWLGQSTRVTEILFKTTELGRVKAKLPEDDFSAEADFLEKELASIAYDSSNVNDVLMWESAWLYQQCLLRDATPATPGIPETVDRILQYLFRSVRGSDRHSSALAFPLFIAAVELDPLKDDEMVFDDVNSSPTSGRRLVLDILHAISDACFFNNSRIGDVIRQVWAHRDLQSERRDESQRSKEALNDWNFYVRPYCTNLSLA